MKVVIHAGVLKGARKWIGLKRDVKCSEKRWC